MEDFVCKLEIMLDKHGKAWKKYVRITKEEYDKKHHIAQKLESNRQQFKPGNKIVYYVGDLQLPNNDTLHTK